MCFSSALAALIGLSSVNCEAAPGLGPDPVTHTDAAEISLTEKESGIVIKCPQGTADCISRAQAICQGNFRVVPPSGRGPRVQALVNLKIETINTHDPYKIRIVCE
jgi:hypothetical protein